MSKPEYQLAMGPLFWFVITATLAASIYGMVYTHRIATTLDMLQTQVEAQGQDHRILADGIVDVLVLEMGSAEQETRPKDPNAIEWGPGIEPSQERDGSSETVTPTQARKGTVA